MYFHPDYKYNIYYQLIKRGDPRLTYRSNNKNTICKKKKIHKIKHLKRENILIQQLLLISGKRKKKCNINNKFHNI